MGNIYIVDYIEIIIMIIMKVILMSSESHFYNSLKLHNVFLVLSTHLSKSSS